MHATRVIMVFLLPCALFDYYGLTSSLESLSLAYSETVKSLSILSYITSEHFSLCVPSYPILSVPNTYTSTPLNMTHLPPSLSPPAQLPFLPSPTHASSALVNTGAVSSSASAATSLASESCFWLEAVDEELGIVAQREPLIIPFSVAVMMSVGVWYKAGF